MSLLIRLQPLLAPVIRRIVGSAKPEVDTLHPEETEKVRPPVMLAGMLDRVTGTDVHSVLSHHLEATLDTVVTHPPVLRLAFRNVLVRRSGFAALRKNEVYDRKLRLAELAGPILPVSELRYCQRYAAWLYFGHWMHDAIPAALIDPGLGALWMPPQPDWGHAPHYLEALDLSVLTAPVIHADRFILYQDFGQGSHKQARYQVIRDRLHAKFGGKRAKERVFLSRGRTGAPRFIANEAKLIDALVARNWLILDISTASMEELQRALCQARVVVSIDGSHLSHAHLSLPPGAAMVVLMPQDRFTSIHLGLCRAHRVSPGIVVLTGTLEKGYHVELDDVLRTVDLAEAAALA